MAPPLANAPARRWLPTAALLAPERRAAAETLLAAWGAHWFLTEAQPRPCAAPGGDASRIGATDLFLGGTAATRDAVARTALGLATLPETTADHELLAGIWRALADDLAARFARAAPSDPADPGDADAAAAPLRLGLAFPGLDRPLLLAVGRATLTGLARAAAPTGTPVTMGRRADALAREAVRLSAHAGPCTLQLAELAGLGVGDVVLLDRSIDAPLALAINGRAVLADACRPETNDGLATLRLIRKPMETPNA